MSLFCLFFSFSEIFGIINERHFSTSTWLFNLGFKTSQRLTVSSQFLPVTDNEFTVPPSEWQWVHSSSQWLKMSSQFLPVTGHEFTVLPSDWPWDHSSSQWLTMSSLFLSMTDHEFTYSPSDWPWVHTSSHSALEFTVSCFGKCINYFQLASFLECLYHAW